MVSSIDGLDGWIGLIDFREGTHETRKSLEVGRNKLLITNKNHLRCWAHLLGYDMIDIGGKFLNKC